MRFLMSLIIAALFLGGCETMNDNIYYQTDKKRYKTVMASSYHAADTLLKRAGNRITRDTPMLIGTVAHINSLEESTPFGRTISEHLATRMVHRGYKVNEIKLRDSINVQDGVGAPERAGEFFLSRNINAIGGEQKAAIVVTGSYAPATDHALVSLRMIDVKTGQIIAATDEMVDMSRDAAHPAGETATRPSFLGIDSLLRGRDDGRSGAVSGRRSRSRGDAEKPSQNQTPVNVQGLLLNDDYTPMDFVVVVLQKFFAKSQQEATDIMMHVHRRGVGVCGIFTYEVAETKVAQVMDYARSHEQPLQCTMEKE